MPDTPTPSVNGQVLSVPALQASMSMLSLAPAASTVDDVPRCLADAPWSMAIAGSFCLFCENGVGGDPLATRTSSWAVALGASTARVNNPASKARAAERQRMGTPPCSELPTTVLYGTVQRKLRS